MGTYPFDVEIDIRNYRCFGPEPVTLHIRDGFTAFVGLNNGGKSALLRLLYELRPLLQIARDTVVYPNQSCYPQYISDGERAWRAGTDDPIDLVIRVGSTPDIPPQRATDGPLSYTIRYDRNGAATGEVLLGGRAADRRTVATGRFTRLEVASRLLSDTLYVGPFRNAVAPGGGQYYDLVSGQAFVETFRQYKSGASPEHNEAVMVLQQNIARIFGFERFELNPSADAKSLQVFVDGRSFRLSELGSGLSHFVVVLVNVLVRKPSLLLVDEPELNLHASLQLDFLTTLAKYADIGVMFATHSMGLARSAADHIYVVDHHAEPGRQVVPYEGTRSVASIAAQLGFDSVPEVGYDTVLLVEGKSDVRTVMQLLRMYRKEHRIALVPLGGGDLIGPDVELELRELKRLGPVKYLVDSERDREGGDPSARHAAFAQLCADLDVGGLMLERRALENYLPQHALDRVFGVGSVSALEPYAKRVAGAGWKKMYNWKVAAEMTSQDLDGTDLDAFLSTL